MDKQIKLIRKIWKTGATGLVVMTMVFGGLFLNIKAVGATNPNLTLRYLGNNNDDPNDSWDKDVTVNAGQYIQLYAEIHNTNVPTTANNVKLQASLPSTSGTSNATVSADNASSVSDSVNITVNGGQLEYVPGSTEVTWDVNGDGNLEYNHTGVGDGVVGSGLVLGNQQGCNQYIIQVSFLAKVVENEQPTPSPSPTPIVSPTPVPSNPPSGGQEQHQEQTQNNNQNQTVNVTNTNNNTVNVPQVAGVKVPAKTPDTGISVLGVSLMAGAAPIGYALSRFGNGRVITKKKEESLSEFANGLMSNRSGKSTDA